MQLTDYTMYELAGCLQSPLYPPQNNP